MQGRRGLIVIPEGCEGWGWTIFAAEVRKVVAFLGSSPRVVLRRSFDGLLPSEAGD